jgi:hypothetical protein
VAVCPKDTLATKTQDSHIRVGFAESSFRDHMGTDAR